MHRKVKGKVVEEFPQEMGVGVYFHHHAHRVILFGFCSQGFALVRFAEGFACRGLIFLGFFIKR